jgi:hypothetical protein
MKKKALLLMLFCMFISTNALSQVSCGVAAAIDLDCLRIEEGFCEAQGDFRLAGCSRVEQRCEENVRNSQDLCVFLTGEAFQRCMFDVMAADDRCYWLQLECNYEALDSYYECLLDIDCEE